MNYLRPPENSTISLTEIVKKCGFISDGDWVESKDQDPEGDVRLIQLADVGIGAYLNKSSRFLTASKARELKCTFLLPGDILVARMPDPIGRACIFPGDEKASVTVVDVCIIRPDPATCDARWLCWMMNSPEFLGSVQRQARGATRQRISRKELERLHVPRIDIAEQRRIAAILDEADALRAKRRAARAQLDEMARAIFVEMFGTTRNNPKNLPKERLGNLLKLKSGDFLPASAMVEGEHLVFGGNGVNGQHNTYNASEEKIVIGRVGAYCGCVHISPPKSWITDNALYVSDIKEDVDFLYLAAALQHADLNSVSSQFGQPLISGSRVYPVEILIPAIQDQREFVNRLRAKDGLLECAAASEKRLDSLFSSLQHRAFRGEL
ncbi:restriction endonuclease subunit S [Roseomonas xinghualingensis]|uniref:restriction endonuclease subunit S n=1 Tax=Roseomonas xinghualingensis TaxID=2986475 RepID=UPI0021F1C83B|nr:restriction endonuclease subunit S [Roseomonas sp. SXEYE001]MCV4209763.1 restriction endonuclease subunit S [Roseomonas sp. SXEYE001]